MRDDFRRIVTGWTLIYNMDDLTERIERAAQWTRQNRPLETDESESPSSQMVDLHLTGTVRNG